MKKIQSFYLHQREITFVINILLHVKIKRDEPLVHQINGSIFVFFFFEGGGGGIFTKKIQLFYLHRGVHFCDKYSVAGISQNKKG